MKRQLRKVIFLPANITVLTDNENIGSKLIKVTRKDFNDLPLWKKLTSLVIPGIRKEMILDQNNENNYQGSIWKAIEYSKQHGYEVLLYPENDSSLSLEDLDSGIQHLMDKNLTTGIIHGNKVDDFLKASTDFNINLHNSILVSKDPAIVEPFLERYKPLNCYDSFSPFPTKPLCFSIIYWNPSNSERKRDIHIKNTTQLPFEINWVIHPGNLIYSCCEFPFMSDKILFIDDSLNENINNFINENIQRIQKQAKEKGCSFVYFSKFQEEGQLQDFFLEYLKYSYPDRHVEFTSDFLTLQHQLSPDIYNNLLLDLLNLPAFHTPALLRSRGSIADARSNEFSVFTFDIGKDIQSQFDSYFEFLQPANDLTDVRFRIADLRNKTVDDTFWEESNNLAEDVIRKIEYLKDQGMYSLLAEIALRIVDSNSVPVFNQLAIVGKPLEIKTDIVPELSRLRIDWVSKYDFQITLPDYGNMIVEMPRLPKALYYFFLKHPEGVMLNSLSDYKEELRTIYERISNKSDKEEIARNIERLVDPLDNSVNVNCSRIKNAFVKLIDDRLARSYYITGYRGEPKKISLPVAFIEIIQKY
ncbi:hypothetical protein AQPE_2017 [Aquipluma nitroreducens]|uniref:Uncharacterized protein n=1 Tax=Aquipluma nitroreducens TaxID=2010828 RepID=A0A5K7S8H3_9BACT|nr:hypothetical protein [Aquipluma nitroreducens]BBE17858.1 hypothetical protein AQPE_2017 [Aquipluma nitroreducens]